MAAVTPAGVGPRTEEETMERDDLYTMIHKALRRGLVDVLVEAGRTEFTDRDQVAALSTSWQRFESLLRAHAGHERDFIHPALNAVVPGGTDALDADHDHVHDLLDRIAIQFASLSCEQDPRRRRQRGLELYRALGRFIVTAFAHFDDEETQMMPRLWALLTDDQLAEMREAIMAAIGPDEAAYTFELMSGAFTPEELDEVRRRAPAAAAIAS